MSESPPRRRKRWTVRKLMFGIAVVAVLLALLRQPFLFWRDYQHFRLRFDEAEGHIDSYKTHVPPGMAPAQWTDGVETIRNAWGNMVCAPSVLPPKDLDALVAWWAAHAAAATPTSAEGDLFELLDRLALGKSISWRGFVHGTHHDAYLLWYPEAPSQILVSDTLRRLGRPQAEPWPTLTRAAREGTPLERLASLRALGHLSRIEQSEQAAAVLVHALQDDQPFVVQEALESLIFMGPLAAPAVPALAELAQGDDDWLRQVAIMVLEAIGPGAAPAKEVLLALLHDPSEYVRVGAAEALAAMGLLDDEGLPLWTSLLERQSGVVYVAIDALEAMGPAAQPALPKLRLVAEDHEYEDAKRLATATIQSIEAAAGSNAAGTPSEAGDDGIQRHE